MIRLQKFALSIPCLDLNVSVLASKLLKENKGPISGA